MNTVSAPARQNRTLNLILFLVLALLLIIALFVPPISLQDRIAGRGMDSFAAEQDAGVTDPDGTQVAFPAYGVADGFRARLVGSPRAEFLSGEAGDAARLAAEALPSNLVPRSPWYQLQIDGNQPLASVLTVGVPTDSGPVETLDLQEWTGEEWRFIPSHIIGEPPNDKILAELNYVPGSFMVMQSNAMPPTAAAVLPEGIQVPEEGRDALTEANPRGFQLQGDGSIQGEAAASAGAGVTGAFPIGASGSRTAVNDSVGGRTQVAAFFAGATVLVVLLFLTEPISYLPSSVLAAVIVSAALGLVDPGAWRTLWGTDRVEVAIAAVTMAGVVAVGVLEALLFAVGLSVIDVVRRSANPHDAVLGWVERLGRYADVAVHRDAVTIPGVVVYRLDDRLFFANADYFKARIREAIRGAGSPLSVVVVDGEGITHVDASGLDALSQVRAELGEDGVRLVFARFKEPVLEDLMNPESAAGITAGDVFPTVRAAVEACSAATSQSG